MGLAMCISALDQRHRLWSAICIADDGGNKGNASGPLYWD